MSSKPGAVCGLAFDKRRLKKSLVKCGCGASLGIFGELVMSVSMKAGSVSKSGVASQGREGVSHRFAHFVEVGGELTSLVIERDGGGVSGVENVVDCLFYALVRNEGVVEFLVRLCLFL